MSAPDETLDLSIQEAQQSHERSFVSSEIETQVDYICRNRNRSGIRFMLACLLAKIQQPDIDIRKPYTEIPGDDSYSGRTYDERYIGIFALKHELPCNTTTAFLTPAWRNINQTLATDMTIEGSPRKLYQTILILLDDIQSHKITSNNLLKEILRYLILIRDERQQRLTSLLKELNTDTDLILSSEQIIRIMEQHLQQPRSSRLPVLMIAAIYQTLDAYLPQDMLDLQAHNAADTQTRAIGDLEIILPDEKRTVTAYEMKTRPVSREDIDIALRKIAQSGKRLDNYIFITTESISEDIVTYAASLYTKSGTEFVLLNCIEFTRYFLHLFHWLRLDFLNHYQRLVLSEPGSGVNPALKEVLLVLRHTAELSLNADD
ncbi:MAG: restriction endonuclease, SacI family [Aggregatilineales bacterium]